MVNNKNKFLIDKVNYTMQKQQKLPSLLERWTTLVNNNKKKNEKASRNSKSILSPINLEMIQICMSSSIVTISFF